MSRGTIKSGIEIDSLFKHGAHFNSKNLSIIVSQNGEMQRGPQGRVAFIAGKRLGNAVVRNRSKRVLRAVAREAGLPSAGRDVVLIATRATRSASHEDVVASLLRLLKKAGVR